MSLASNIAFLSQSLQEKGALYYSDLKALRWAAWKLIEGPSRVLDFPMEVVGTALPSTRPTSRRVMLFDDKLTLAGVMNRVSTHSGDWEPGLGGAPREIQVVVTECSWGLVMAIAKRHALVQCVMLVRKGLLGSGSLA